MQEFRVYIYICKKYDVEENSINKKFDEKLFAEEVIYLFIYLFIYSVIYLFIFLLAVFSLAIQQ